MFFEFFLKFNHFYAVFSIICLIFLSLNVRFKGGQFQTHELISGLLEDLHGQISPGMSIMSKKNRWIST